MIEKNSFTVLQNRLVSKLICYCVSCWQEVSGKHKLFYKSHTSPIEQIYIWQ